MNFALILFCLLLASGAIWVADISFFKKRRTPGAKDPWWVEYGASFFPVILFVFVLRSFIVEPFKIPSGSMIPTLQVGDFILVNKFTYGIRLPVINKKITEGNKPQRGEVIAHPDGFEIEVTDADPRRVKRVRLRRVEPAASPAKPDAA